MQKKRSNRISHHPKSLDAAILDPGEQEPGRAVEQSEDPAADDDAPRPGQRADVLNMRTGVRRDVLNRGSEKMLS